MTRLIREQASRAQQSGDLPQQLAKLTDDVQVPEMPQTAAVLERIPASEDHPGAILRLAGDRCPALPCPALPCTLLHAALSSGWPPPALHCLFRPSTLQHCCHAHTQLHSKVPSNTVCALIVMAMAAVGMYKWSMVQWSWT